MRRPICLIIALAVLLAGPRALADDAPELETAPDPAVLVNEAELHIPATGRTYKLVPGTWLLAPPSWTKLETELKRLQDAETRLSAENKSMRETSSGWRPGWKLLLGAFAVGATSGAYAYYKLR